MWSLEPVWFKVTALTSEASFEMVVDSTWLSFRTRTLDAAICSERILATQKLLYGRIHAKRPCENKRDVKPLPDV